MNDFPVIKRILFVDDEPNILLGLQRLLRAHRDEWDMTFVPSAEEALALLAKEQFHIIVSDLRMPKMNGVQLLEEVKKSYPEMIRLILSGHANTDLIIQSVGAAHQFLAKPCDAEILQHAIVRAFSLREVFRSDELTRIVKDGSSLPTLPDLYHKLTAALKSPLRSADTIAGIIMRDITMSAKILQLVNSAFFGLSRKVDSISHAVTLLGAETINNIVITTSVFGKFGEELVEKFDIREIYAHSLRVGTASSNLIAATLNDKKKSDEAMLAGMMHDLGKLVFINSAQKEWDNLYLGRKAYQEPFHVLEKKAFGISHAEVGAYLLGLWGLSNNVVEAVAFHHEPNYSPVKEFGTLAAIHLANTLDVNHQKLGYGMLALDRGYLDAIGIGEKIEEYGHLCQMSSMDATG